jgi:hypothetical protein
MLTILDAKVAFATGMQVSISIGQLSVRWLEHFYFAYETLLQVIEPP